MRMDRKAIFFFKNFFPKLRSQRGIVVHDFSRGTKEAEAGLFESEAGLVYKSSGPGRATELDLL